MRHILPILFLLISISISAQSKAETRSYNRAISKNIVHEYDKFLDKYPNSSYVEDILYRKDSLVFYSIAADDVYGFYNFSNERGDSKFYARAIANVEELNKSNITNAQAEEIISKMIPGEVEMYIPLRSFGGDFIFAFTTENSSYTIHKLIRNGLSEDKNEWILAPLITPYRETRYSDLEGIKFRNDLKEVKIAGRRYLVFSYENFTTSDKAVNPKNREVVAVAFDLESSSVYSYIFSGVEMESNGKIWIEGEIVEMGSSNMVEVIEYNYLKTYIQGLPNLKLISKENKIADEEVRWWYDNNKSSRINYGTLSSESAIIGEFLKQKKVVTSKSYNASFFDYRGNTLVVLKEGSDYILLWAEPSVQDKDRDKFLNTIYFENVNTLVFYYYEGNRTDKKRLDIPKNRFR